MNTVAKLSAYGVALALLVTGAYGVGAAVGLEPPRPPPAGTSTPTRHRRGAGRTAGNPARRARVEQRRLHPDPDRPDARPGTDRDLLLPDHGSGRGTGHRVRRRARQADAPDRGAPRLHRLPAPAPGDGRRRHLVGAADGVGRWVVPGLRRLRPDQRRADHARSRPLRARCVRAAHARRDPHRPGGRLHGAADRRPRRRAGRTDHARDQPRRCAGHRPAALSRRVRPSGRAARGRPGLPARAPRRPATAAAGPQVSFVAEVPSAGRYRLFLDFQHDDTVRTAEFTVPTGHGP